MNPPPCPRCPTGGEIVTVVYFVTTLDGLDCRCEICGTEWHAEFPPRRATDSSDGPLRLKEWRRFPQLTPLPLNCPECPRQMVYITTLDHNIHVYLCEVHGEWHLGPGGVYAPDNPPPAARALLGESKPH